MHPATAVANGPIFFVLSPTMLKALELNGFKSFADVTRFDFPDGITVVVGPNGSGKSNIVDAIKWVLGSQSAKGLRGGDMSDVIFKGSASSGRKPANSAEATLVLDNASRALSIDADEVTVTRRVYRSGESEYLINREPCRLKDIRDLFRGTGVGVDAYSLIEQGKVDRMLQASPKDRRAIFEEAAGISRFKAKKVEAERRLQRVNQNLLRLSDIVEEVHGRLTVIKNQASKAQRYREMVARLVHLRAYLGYAEIKDLKNLEADLKTKAATLVGELESKRSNLEVSTKEIADKQAFVASLRTGVNDIQTDIRRIETSEVTLQSQQLSLQERTNDLNLELDSIAQQIDQLRRKRDNSAEQITLRQGSLDAMFSQREQLELAIDTTKQHAELTAQECQSTLQQLEQTRSLLERLRGESTSKTYESASLTNRIGERQAKIQQRQSELSRLHEHAAAAHAQSVQAAELSFQKQQLLQSAEQALIDSRNNVQLKRESLRLASEQSIVLQGKYESMQDRHGLLEQLDSEHTGLGDGAKQLMELSKAKPHAPFDSITGLVADIISVEVHLAPLIDVALSHLSEAVVLSDGQIVDLLQQRRLKLTGRATLFRLDRLPSRRNGDRIQLDGLRGVIGRADRLVHVEERFQTLAQFLLGTTWLVDSLQTALDLSHYRGSGLRFVTADCERIDTDGTIQIGSLQTLSGIVTRRSEMQAVRGEAEKLMQAIEASASEVAALRITLDKAIEQETAAEVQTATARAESEQSRFDALKKSQDHDAIELKVKTLTEDVISLQSSLHIDHQHLIEIAQQSNSYATQIQELENQYTDQQELSKKLQLENVAALDAVAAEKLEKAKFDHRLSSEEELLRTMMLDFDERQLIAAQAELRQQEITTKLDSNRRTIETNVAAAAVLAAQLETARNELNQRNGELTQAIAGLAVDEKNLQVLRSECDRLAQQQEETNAALIQTDEKRRVSVQHYLNEYEIDLTKPRPAEFEEESIDKNSALREINELRPEIAAVGSVNLEALAELDELQSRYDKLHAHYVDLESARDSLLKIIERIEDKSRDMFLTTLETIRTNFQTLYRRSFGGGSADIVLEDPNDVLNCGVDVIATPPGKIALSNSLLSGGEKALTAVALIMAIFQFRPSPFCILDEVDAPFDEANIGRFVNVLRDFLHMTKFIVVSHSKKTMTVANTIYGVTMQESGISRQVAVRFEEVGPDGEILTAHHKAA